MKQYNVHFLCRWSNSISGSESTVILESPKPEEAKEEPGMHDLDILPGLVEELRMRRTLCHRRRPVSTCASSSDSDTPGYAGNNDKPKPFYKFQIFPLISKYFWKIHYDRLALLALLDRYVVLCTDYFIDLEAFCCKK